MKYKIYILRQAQKELAQLPSDYYRQTKEVIRALAHHPRPPGAIKLTGRNGWRLRIGPYRVIFEIDDVKKTLTILHIGHRRDVYR